VTDGAYTGLRPFFTNACCRSFSGRRRQRDCFGRRQITNVVPRSFSEAWVHACLKRLLRRRCVPLAEPAGNRVLGGQCVSTWASIARHAQGHEAVGRPAKLVEDGYGFIESLAEQEAWSGSGRLTHDSVSFLLVGCGIQSHRETL
jgi:hypothetical protein